MTTRLSGSYVHNVICDICGRKFKSTELQKRWDGYMVCEKDWEPRNILDFYRVRNDVHPLDWTRSDDSGNLTWTIDTSHWVMTDNLGLAQILPTYNTDGINSKINFQLQFNCTVNATIVSDGFINHFITLPQTVVTAGSYRVTYDNGVVVRNTTAIAPAATTINLGSALDINVGGTYPKNLIIIGQYGI